MAEDGSSGPRAPEPAQVDSHEGDRHEAPRGRGASRPKGDGGAKGKDKAKVRAAQGKGPSPAKGKKSSKGKVSSGKAPAQSSSYRAKGTEGTEGVRRRSASSIEYSRRRAGKRQREAGQFVRWSKEPAQPSGAKAPPPPPPPRRTAARTEEYSYYSDESGAAPIRLRSRSPNDPRDTRRPAEPARAPKSRNTEVKSEARAVVTNQPGAESSGSSSTTEAEDAPAGADKARAMAAKRRPRKAVPEAAAAPAIPGEKPGRGAPSDQGATPGPSPGATPVAEPGLEEPPSPRAKQESSDSCFEPVRLVQAQPLTEEHRALPPPDFAVSMKFSIQLKDSRKEPCSARYLHAVSVEYHTHAVGDEPGSVVKTDLQVLGLGGSRVVVRSPANPTLAWKLSRESQDTEREMFRIMGNWTPTRIRALGVHRVKEIGKGAAAFYVSVLEQELCAPCPQFSPSVAFELLLTVAHTAKLVQVRDLGRKNVGSRRRDSGQMGEPPKDAILLVDANYWQQYKTGSRPHWPNRQRAQGLWSSLQTFTPDLVPKVQELVHRFHADLESLTTSLFSLMDASLAEVEVAEVCDNLVSTQVLGLSPDGQLCQYVLWDASFHSLEVGHQWGMVPIRNLSKSKLKPRAATSGSIKKP